ncbi:hypothetical protein EVAR_22275_1 [Eumeta japonica]|uniref:Uncharacterized protein n=1 Tax=Eumeta variegata TaxID=151549 RepID=A0A4C1UBT7_EUMVA|nr:hypothetical protein EVAR_22275_1 [Eumeta japonica]
MCIQLKLNRVTRPVPRRTRQDAGRGRDRRRPSAAPDSRGSTMLKIIYAVEPCCGQLGCSTKMGRLDRYPILTKEAGNALMTALELEVSIGGDDHPL